MNRYMQQLQQLEDSEQMDAGLRKELRDSRSARREASSDEEVSKELARLPYNNRPDYIGERWRNN